jgi:hypothetical protein
MKRPKYRTYLINFTALALFLALAGIGAYFALKEMSSHFRGIVFKRATPNPTDEGDNLPECTIYLNDVKIENTNGDSHPYLIDKPMLDDLFTRNQEIDIRITERESLRFTGGGIQGIVFQKDSLIHHYKMLVKRNSEYGTESKQAMFDFRVENPEGRNLRVMGIKVELSIRHLGVIVHLRFSDVPLKDLPPRDIPHIPLPDRPPM